MSRTFSIWIRQITGTLPPDTTADGLNAETQLCAFAISGQGNRISLPPRPFFAAVPGETYDITRNTITPKWQFNINDNDTEHLFCIWMLEKDNEVIRANWARLEETFHATVDANLQRIENLGYTDVQKYFLAFTESILLLHGKMQEIKGTRSWLSTDNNDDVYLPGIFHFAHADGNTLPPLPGLSYHPARDAAYEGFCANRVYIDAQHPFDLTFRYVYSTASGILPVAE
jgi:hypothetical protein